MSFAGAILLDPLRNCDIVYCGMKKILRVAGYCLLVTSIAGCVPLKKITRPIVRVISPAVAMSLPAYSGPKARLAVSNFEVKTAKAAPDVAAELREILIASLLESKRFLVIEPANAAPDLVVNPMLTEFMPQASGGRSGVGGGGSAGGALNSLLGTGLNKARVTLEIRIIDSSKAKVLANRRIEGQAADMEKAIRICIIETIRYISQVVPANYYKY